MKNKIKYMIVLLMTFFISIQPVLAAKTEDSKLPYIQCGDSAIPAPIPGITRIIIILLKIVLPIALIIMGLLDFVKAVSSSNEEAIKKSQNQFIKRLISAGIFFMVITLVQFAVDIVTQGSKEGGIGKCINCLISGTDCGGETTIPFGE